MNAKRAFLLELATYIRSNTASTYFVSGIPGSGNVELLTYVQEYLPREVRQTFVLGVFKPTLPDLSQFVSQIGEELTNAGFITEAIDVECQNENLSSFWQWVREHHCFPRNQSLLVLIDLTHLDVPMNVEEIGLFFSSLRALAANHKMVSSGFQLHHVVTGFWQHVELDRYYRDVTSISFPYTMGVNYCYWKGFGSEDIYELLFEQPYRSLRAQLLYELTDGYVTAIKEILANAPRTQVSMRNVIETAQKIAVHGESSKTLIRFWKQLPAHLFYRIRLLLQYQRLPANAAPDDWDMLNQAGLVRLTGQMPNRTVQIRSWFVELVVRLQWSHLTKIPPVETAIDQLIPQLQTYNRAAYEMIYEMETTARNFAVLLLSQAGDQPNLKGRVIKRNQRGEDEDLQLRATLAKENAERVARETIPHPLIAYTQLKDLGTLFEEMAESLRNVNLRDVSKLLSDLSTVRNQVMHNQVIGDETLELLESLRSKLFQEIAGLARTASLNGATLN